jgi:soluble epoxide hydrolase/lipid-phosphate phosphatase
MEETVTHDTLECNGIQLHVAQQGQGPAVVLCHGFPELWYVWRKQMSALAAAGYRAIAPDMRGAGGTSAPSNPREYTQENICQDIVALMDQLQLKQAVIVGHDWGSAVAWNMALHHAARVRAVGGINATGVIHVQMPVSALEVMCASPGIWDYQLYFQEPGVAEAELEEDMTRFVKLMFRSSDPRDQYDILRDFGSARERGGILVGFPLDPKPSVMLTADDVEYIVQQHRQTGMRGALNWYRVHDENFAWGKAVIGKKIEQPALVVTAGRDPVMTPDLTQGMEELAPNLTRHHIEECSHWTQMEQPDLLSNILIDWLDRLPQEA